MLVLQLMTFFLGGGPMRGQMVDYARPANPTMNPGVTNYAQKMNMATAGNTGQVMFNNQQYGSVNKKALPYHHGYNAPVGPTDQAAMQMGQMDEWQMYAGNQQMPYQGQQQGMQSSQAIMHSMSTSRMSQPNMATMQMNQHVMSAQGIAESTNTQPNMMQQRPYPPQQHYWGKY